MQTGTMGSPTNNRRFVQALQLFGLLLLAGFLLDRLTISSPKDADVQTAPPNATAAADSVPVDQSLDAQLASASGGDFSLTPARDPGLFSQLSAGDRAWIPRAEPIPGGGTRYLYKKRSDQPPLSLNQIKALMENPPTFEAEHRLIRSLLETLRTSGVTIILGQPRKQGAAGEWEPAKATLRIRPDIPSKGSREFLRVLNHEAIHVAQSCSNGELKARPKLLGLPRQLDQMALQHLNEAVYSNVSASERLLEEEAYANQERSHLAGQLVGAHCRAS